MSVRVGTSGWVYPHWRGLFYPTKVRQADWFAFFAREFDTVEINNSFYRLPSEAAFDNWRQQAPPGGSRRRCGLPGRRETAVQRPQPRHLAR